ncbi:MAG: hypothetical protein M1607_01535 [Patescibacteria group bacterium]|nr:hypothetical protein [Patescibacteria group bacterium]
MSSTQESGKDESYLDRIAKSIDASKERERAGTDQSVYITRREALFSLLDIFKARVRINSSMTEIKTRFLPDWKNYTYKGYDFYSWYADEPKDEELANSYIGGFLSGTSLLKEDEDRAKVLFVGLTGDYILDFLRGQDIRNPIQGFGVGYADADNSHSSLIELISMIRDASDMFKIYYNTSRTFLGSYVPIPNFLTRGSIVELTNFLLDSKTIISCKQALEEGLENIFANNALNAGMADVQTFENKYVNHPQNTAKQPDKLTWSQYTEYLGELLGNHDHGNYTHLLELAKTLVNRHGTERWLYKGYYGFKRHAPKPRNKYEEISTSLDTTESQPRLPTREQMERLIAAQEQAVVEARYRTGPPVPAGSTLPPGWRNGPPFAKIPDLAEILSRPTPSIRSGPD